MICESKMENGYYWWLCDESWELVLLECGEWYWFDGGLIHSELIDGCVLTRILPPNHKGDRL